MYLNKIKCKFNNKEYLSKIYPKEKAEEKYNDTLSEGNNAIYCKYDPETTSYILNIGYLEPNSIIEFKSTFYYLVNSSNNYYSFSLYKIYPNKINCGYCYYHYKRIRGNITVKTISKIENM